MNPERNCYQCGERIAKERLEFQPDTEVCVPCLTANGDVATYSGVPCYNHKTGASTGIIGPKAGKELNRLIANQYKRVRYRGSGYGS